jgi:hypothetical protein
MNTPFSPEEAAICARRGQHHPDTTSIFREPKWRQCKWCGTWCREVWTKEERVDTPPAAVEETHPMERMSRE